MLCFLWLSLSVCSLVHCVVTTTQSSPADQLTKCQTRKCDDGLGAVVAQLVGDQSKMAVKLQAMETRLKATETKLASTETKLQATETKLNATETKLQATETKLENTTAELQASKAEVSSRIRSGSSFVRWGRKTCPSNTTLVYVGVAGGKHHNEKGSGTNPLCLTRMPQFDNTPKPSDYGHLYGGEYQDIAGHYNHDVPCSVCLVPQSSTIMVPATLTCPPGWTPQYNGHLSSQHDRNFATEYVCLDGSPEHDSSGVRDDNGLLFHYVVTVCGCLPCPPYTNNTVVTCVVCSK